MIKYVYLFKFKKDTSQETIDHTLDLLMNELPQRCAHILSWSWGKDIGSGEDDPGYAYCAEFNDIKALEQYWQHEIYRAIHGKIEPLFEDATGAYFEV